MMTADGPRVLEFNVRFGDPETQAILPRLRSRSARAARGGHRARRAGRRAPLEWSPEDLAVTVVLASAGYPESFPAAT